MFTSTQVGRSPSMLRHKNLNYRRLRIQMRGTLNTV